MALGILAGRLAFPELETEIPQRPPLKVSMVSNFKVGFQFWKTNFSIEINNFSLGGMNHKKRPTRHLKAAPQSFQNAIRFGFKDPKMLYRGRP